MADKHGIYIILLVFLYEWASCTAHRSFGLLKFNSHIRRGSILNKNRHTVSTVIVKNCCLWQVSGFIQQLCSSHWHKYRQETCGCLSSSLVLTAESVPLKQSNNIHNIHFHFVHQISQYKLKFKTFSPFLLYHCIWFTSMTRGHNYHTCRPCYARARRHGPEDGALTIFSACNLVCNFILFEEIQHRSSSLGPSSLHTSIKSGNNKEFNNVTHRGSLKLHILGAGQNLMLCDFCDLIVQ